MPALKELHLASCMNDLVAKIEISDKIKNKPTHLLVSSVNTMFREADKCFENRDEETAYYHYMRCIDLILVVKAKPDFKKNESKLMLENVHVAITRAETLKRSLEKRYAELAKQNEKNTLISQLQERKTSPVSEISSNIISEITPKIPQAIKSKGKLSIKSSELFEMLKLPQPSLIIMDTRHARDFSESHIKHSCCINIPQEILKPGITALKLQNSLPDESRFLWSKRAEMDCIVLLDVDSKNETTKNIYVNALKTAMSKWDTKKLKKNPLILEGGYVDWMSKYPMYTTQVMNFDLFNGDQTPSILADLSEIEYPNLDENPIDDRVQKLNAKNSSDMLFKKTSIPISNMNGHTTLPQNLQAEIKKRYSAPVVDRRSKPQNVPNKSSSAAGFKNGTISDKNVPPLVDRNLKKNNSMVEENMRNSFNKENIEIVNQELKEKDELDNKIDPDKKIDFPNVKSKSPEFEREGKDISLSENRENTTKQKEFELTKINSISGSSNSSLDESVFSEISGIQINESIPSKSMENQMKKETKDTESVILPSKTDYRAIKSAHAISSSERLSRQSSTDSTGLVRSHSFPNIAQMDNEALNMQKKTPQIDRSLKPKVITNSHSSEINRARQRNLNPVYGNCPVLPGTGLRNLGNTCFMNSVIQCLSNTIPLADYILSGRYSNHISNNKSTGGEVFEEFAVVIRSLWMGQYKSFSPKDFKNTVSRCLSVCIGNEQQDAHEFLVVLMEKLHADLSKKHGRMIPKLEQDCSENAFWQHHKAYNSSRVSEIFEGMLKSTLTCISCRKISNSFEVSSCLSLPILTSRCTLRECFKHFLKPEKIAAWDCPRCKQKKEAEKRLSICRLPEILVIQLKRFSYEGLWRRKLQTHVDFDFEFAVPYEENSYEHSRLYSLYGIVNHYGTLEGGHYTAYCKTNTGKWFKFDDHEVSEISSSDIKTSAAYLLFYITADFQSHL